MPKCQVVWTEVPKRTGYDPSVEKRGGLPKHIEDVALAILRRNPTWTVQRAIATAINSDKARLATTRERNFKGNPRIRAKKMPAIAAGIARWTAMKGKGRKS